MHVKESLEIRGFYKLAKIKNKGEIRSKKFSGNRSKTQRQKDKKLRASMQKANMQLVEFPEKGKRDMVWKKNLNLQIQDANRGPIKHPV